MKQYISDAIKSVIGKNLESIARLGDAEVLVEFGDGTKVKVSVQGDCCSHSIFYAIEMPETIRGATLEDVSASGYPEDSESVRTADDETTALEKVKESGIEFYPDYNRVWNVVLKTNRGNALIRHINSSNGYYDGDVYFEIQAPTGT